MLGRRAKWVVRLLVLVVGGGLSVYGCRHIQRAYWNMPVFSKDRFPYFFCVVARDASGKYHPAVLCQWSRHLLRERDGRLEVDAREVESSRETWADERLVFVVPEEEVRYKLRIDSSSIPRIETEISAPDRMLGQVYGLRILEEGPPGQAQVVELVIDRGGDFRYRYVYRVTDTAILPLQWGMLNRNSMYHSLRNSWGVFFLLLVLYFLGKVWYSKYRARKRAGAGVQGLRREEGMSERVDKDARTWGMWCHLSALAMLTCLPLANVLGPLIVWLIKRNEIPFVNEQGKEALNFQITVVLAVIVVELYLSLTGGGILLGLALLVVDVVFITLASVAANKGESYRYPVSLRLIK